ncbi:Putative uncharacterized transposon-derived protein [Frankliniella fusca]|uniref:Uncharacterized transposon-derived protein n=1 Tax=Frankliniella fusca TaxID=407009 RepID=A0AAE1I675_9NEOP|nr:Putative uncharacterized transposon-derived protein [Frankliniella fusca]
MNHVKKMILVPHESVARLNDPTPSTTVTQLNTLDREMEKIMRKKYADDSLKWKLYNEALQRYLHFNGEQTKPVEISISSVNGEENETTSIREQLAEALPKTYKAAALRLYDYLSRADSKVTWDSSGVVSLNNQPVPHSNIIDLISDLTRSRKNFEPIGKENFVKALSLTNIPLELIPNEKRRNAIILARNQGGGGAVVPITKRRVSKTPKRLTTPAYGTAWKLWNATGVSKEKAHRYLQGEDAFTLHKPARRRFPRNVTYADNIDESWQTDLTDFQSLKKDNDGYSFILCVIDVFSKYGWAVPMKDKSGTSIVKGFEAIFEQAGPPFRQTPTRLFSDKGKEYMNKTFQKFLKDNSITYVHTHNPDIKCSVKVTKPEAFKIAYIVRSKGTKGKRQHLVHWRGYPVKSRSWIFEKDIV